MLADKTLLSVTLAATFASGTFVGYALKGVPPAGAAHDAASIYAPQLAELRAHGYDAAEMEQARVVYADYLKSYETWWNTFLEVHRNNVDKIEETRTKKLADLEARHAQRTGTK